MILSDSTSISGSSSSFSANQKQEHFTFLKKPLYHRINKLIRNLYAYLISVLIPIKPYTQTIFFIHSAQILIMALFFHPYSQQYDPVYTKTLDVLSILVRILPNSNPKGNMFYVGVVLNIILFSFVILFAICIYFFKKYSFLHRALLYILTLSIPFIIYILNPICISIITELIIYESSTVNDRICAYILISAVILVLLCTVLLFVVSVFFVPLPYSTVMQHLQCVPILVPLVLNVSATLFNYVDNSWKIALLAVSLVCYIAYFPLIHYFGCFLSREEEILTCTVSCVGSIMIVVAGLYHFTGSYVPSFTIAAYIPLFIGFYLFIKFRTINKMSSYLNLLATVESNIEVLKDIPKWKLRQISVIGLYYGSAYTQSFRLYTDILQMDNSSLNLMILCAKFLAFSPDTSQELQLIGNTLKFSTKNKLLSRMVASQINTILSRRDTTMNKHLSELLKMLLPLSEITCLKIRNALRASHDSAMTEAIDLFTQASVSIEKTRAQYVNMKHFHSNNKFALNAYTAFLFSTAADYQEYLIAREETLHLIQTHSKFEDEPYKYAKMYFPSIRSIAPKRTTMTTDHEIMNSDCMQALNENDSSMQQRIASLIETVEIPSVRIGTLMYSVFGLITIVIPIIIYPCVQNSLKNNLYELNSYEQAILTILTNFKYIELVAELRRQTFISIFPYVFEIDLEEAGMKAYKEAMSNYEIINNFKLKKFIGVDTSEIQKYLFEDSYPIPEFTNFTDYFMKNTSLISQSLQIVSIAFEMLKHPSMFVDQRELSIMCISAGSLDVLHAQIIELAYQAVHERAKEIRMLYQIITIGYSIVLIIACIFITYLISRRLNYDRQTVVRCFQALPSSIIDSIIERLTKSQTQTTTPGEEDNDNEEAFQKLRTMANSADSSRDSIFSLISVIFFIFVFIEFVFVFVYFNTLLSRFIDIHYHPRNAAKAFSELSTGLLAAGAVNQIDQNIFVPTVERQNVVDRFFEASNAVTLAVDAMTFGNGSKPISYYDPALYSSSLPRCLMKGTSNNEVSKCFSFLNLLESVAARMRNLYYTDINNSKPLDINSENVRLIWRDIVDLVLPEFLSKSLKEIIRFTQMSLYDSSNYYIVLAFVIAVIACACLSFVINHLRTSRNLMKTALDLLNHAPPDAIIKSRLIMSVIGNNFKPIGTNIELDEQFTAAAINKFPLPIYIRRTSDKVVYIINEAAQKLGVDPEFDGEYTEFEKDGHTYMKEVTEIDSNNQMLVITDVTRLREIEDRIAEEERFIQVNFGTILNGISDDYKCDTAAILALNICCDIQKLPEYVSTVIDVIEEIAELNNIGDTVDCIDIQSNIVLVTCGIKAGLNASSAATNAISIGIAVLEYIQTNEPSIIMKLSVASQCIISCMVTVAAYDLVSESYNTAVLLTFSSEENKIMIAQTTFEIVYGAGFKIKENGLKNLAGFGEVNTYLIRP